MVAMRELFLRDKVWLWAILLLGLSTLDAYLTNEVYGRGGIEVNPVMSPFVGTWGLYLKGLWALAGVVLLGVVFRRWVSVRRVLTVVCVVMLAVCVWNTCSLGLMV